MFDWLKRRKIIKETEQKMLAEKEVDVWPMIISMADKDTKAAMAELGRDWHKLTGDGQRILEEGKAILDAAMDMKGPR